MTDPTTEVPTTDPSDASDASAHTVRLRPGEPTALAVVSAVATTLRRKPLELEPLSTRIDPDALDALVTGASGHGHREELAVSFFFAGCRVVVTPTRVRVSPDPAGR